MPDDDDDRVPSDRRLRRSLVVTYRSFVTRRSRGSHEILSWITREFAERKVDDSPWYSRPAGRPAGRTDPDTMCSSTANSPERRLGANVLFSLDDNDGEKKSRRAVRGERGKERDARYQFFLLPDIFYPFYSCISFIYYVNSRRAHGNAARERKVRNRLYLIDREISSVPVR